MLGTYYMKGMMLIAILGSLGVLFLGVPGVVAEAAPAGLQISPATTSLTLEPGSQGTGQLTVSNTTSNPLPIELSASGFQVQNYSYTYSFDRTAPAAQWFSFSPADLVIPPHDSRTVTYVINVPQTAEPHGEYVSLFATTHQTPSSGGITIQEQIGSLVYLTVNGAVTRSGHLLSFHSPLWYSQSGGSWSAEIEDTGTTHFTSVTTVRLQNLVGRTVATTTLSRLILPNTIRLLVGSLPVPVLPGLYRVQYQIGLGDDPSQTKTEVMWYIPSYCYVIGGVVLLGLLVLVLRHRMKHPLHT